MWYKNVDGSLFRFITMHAFDGETDGQKGDSNRLTVAVAG